MKEERGNRGVARGVLSLTAAAFNFHDSDDEMIL